MVSKPAVILLTLAATASCQGPSEALYSLDQNVCVAATFSSAVVIGRLGAQRPASFPGWTDAQNATRSSVAVSVDEILFDRHEEELNLVQGVSLVAPKDYLSTIAPGARVAVFLRGVSARFNTPFGEELFVDDGQAHFHNGGLYRGPDAFVAESELRSEAARGQLFDWHKGWCQAAGGQLTLSRTQVRSTHMAGPTMAGQQMAA